MKYYITQERKWISEKAVTSGQYDINNVTEITDPGSIKVLDSICNEHKKEEKIQSEEVSEMRRKQGIANTQHLRH